MSSPARGPIVTEKGAWWKTPLLAGLIALMLSLITYSFGAIKNSGNDEQTIQNINEKVDRKVDREKYETDMQWVKDTLKEMRTDIKEIKKEGK